jgi:hypothetical protein
MNISSIYAILDDRYSAAPKVKDHIAASPVCQSTENARLAEALQPLFEKNANNVTYIQPHYTTLPPMF